MRFSCPAFNRVHLWFPSRLLEKRGWYAINNDGSACVRDASRGNRVRQAAAAGEINVPLRKGLFKLEQIYATLAELVTGEKQGRKANDTITVFDSTGLAIEDLATARLVYEKAQQEGRGLAIELVQEG
mgnify:CR=1 FL=1